MNIGGNITVPMWVQDILGPILVLLPDRLIARLLPAAVSFDPVKLPPLPPVPDTITRLYIGPANFAGQGWQWARAVERFGNSVGAVSMAYRLSGQFGFPVDYDVPAAVYVWSRGWQRRQAHFVQENFTHVIVEAERVLFEGPHRGSLKREVGDLRTAGLAVAMLCHGSDIRLPSRHATLNEESPYRSGVWEKTGMLERQASRNAALLARLGAPVFVSTPDLLLDVPSATWLPVVIDVDKWTADTGPFQAKRLPVVAHVPSSTVIKGTDLIDPILRRLHDSGVLEYRRVTGVDAAAMPDVYRGADIVLDQFRIGSYGVAACEAMAAGRLVISHVSSQVREHILGSTGRELPILQATAADLEQVLTEVLRSPADYVETARAGVEFARDVHDGRLAASVLGGFLDQEH